MARFRKGKISVDDAINSYYARHSTQLLNIFGSEKDAKDYMRWADPNAPMSRKFSSKGKATQHYNDLIEERINPLSAELKKARREAKETNPFESGRKLNNRIDKTGFIYEEHDLGVTEGAKKTVIGYYPIKNSNYVLAKVSVAYGSDSPIEGWEYVDSTQFNL